MDKPKLTEEQADQIWYEAAGSDLPKYKQKMIELGYLDKTETKLQKAEGLFEEWMKHPEKDENTSYRVIAAYRKAIEEITCNSSRHLEI
jgi:hypothetical protein